MTTIRVAVTALLEVDLEAWIEEYGYLGDRGTTPDEVAAAVGFCFNQADRMPRRAREAVKYTVRVIEDTITHVGTSCPDGSLVTPQRDTKS